MAAVLRRAGLAPAAITRAGIHVLANGADEVAVETDLESEPATRALHDRALKAVRTAGYPVRVSSDGTPLFYVTRRP